MKYLSICYAKKNIPTMAKADDIEEWVKVSRDDILNKKCKLIKCYETLGDFPQKLIIMIDTDDSDVLNMLSRDFGKDWNLEIYPLHELHQVSEEDHSIVAG